MRHVRVILAYNGRYAVLARACQDAQLVQVESVDKVRTALQFASMLEQDAAERVRYCDMSSGKWATIRTPYGMVFPGSNGPMMNTAPIVALDVAGFGA